MRAIIVDDEELARGYLRELLGAHPEIEIAGECANGFEAVKAIGELHPDLVFLDVRMPKLDGFEVLELIDAAVDAGRDLRDGVRPVRDARVRCARGGLSDEAVQRGTAGPGAGAGAGATGGTQHSAGPGGGGAPGGRAPQRIVVKDGARVHVILVGKLDYVEAQDDYVALHSEGKSYLKQQAIASVEAMLDPAVFVRIHRSAIVNLERVARIEPYGKESRIAILADGTRLPVSRTGYARLLEAMGDRL